MSRSAARSGPSQSQSQRPTQTQRARGGRRQPVEEVPEEEEDEDEEEGVAMDQDGNGDSEVTRKANELVRLALFMEHRRTVLRREDINKKVIGTSRNFNIVFATAQQTLNDTFGMELVELPSRAGLEKDGDDEPNEAQMATGTKKKAVAMGSKTYMLRSTLDTVLVEHAAQTEEDILEEEMADQATFFPSQNPSDDEGDDSDEEGERPTKSYGSLISWSKADQIGSLGILYVILALVLVSGRVISDADLRRHLKTLHVPSNPNIHPIHHTTSATTRALNLDAYLTNTLRQGYLDRKQIGGEGKKGKKGGGVKRLRTQAEDLDEGLSYEWQWGPRAYCEIGEEFVANFVADFMIGSLDEEEDGMNQAHQQQLAKKIYTGVEKAAGGKLIPLK